MNFWDSSALLPLLFDEKSTRTLVSLVTADPIVVVSFITAVEVTSAVTRRGAGDKREAQRIFDVLERGWVVIDDYAVIMRRARRLAAKHGLRSGDAIQLASAAEAGVMSFVCLDDELTAAAHAEGFTVLP